MNDKGAAKRWEYGGQSLTLREWAEKANLQYAAFYKRLRNGWTFGQALGLEHRDGNAATAEAMPLARRRKNAKAYAYEGVVRTIPEWASVTGTPQHTIRTRLERGWTVGEAIGAEPRDEQIAVSGAMMTIREAARQSPVTRTNFVNRLYLGLTPERAIQLPSGHLRQRFIIFDGRCMNVSSWAKEVGLSRQTLYARLLNGWSIEDALTIPVGEKR